MHNIKAKLKNNLELCDSGELSLGKALRTFTYDLNKEFDCFYVRTIWAGPEIEIEFCSDEFKNIVLFVMSLCDEFKNIKIISSLTRYKFNVKNYSVDLYESLVELLHYLIFVNESLCKKC